MVISSYNKFKIFLDAINNLRKKQIIIILFLILFSSVAELFSIGSAIPFLAILTNPNLINNYQFANKVLNLIDPNNYYDIRLIFTLIFLFFIVFSALVRISLLNIMTKFSFDIGKDISINIFSNSIFINYIDHTKINSSVILSNLTIKINVFIAVLLSYLNLVSSIFILLFFFISIIFIANFSIILILILLSSIYIIIAKFFKKKLLHNSKIIGKETSYLVKLIQETHGGIKHILIDGNQDLYLKYFEQNQSILKKSQISNQIIKQSPKFYMELIGMIAIVLFAYYTSSTIDGNLKLFPILGALALTSQRLLPILQLAFNSWAMIKGESKTFNDILTSISKIKFYNNQSEEKLHFNDKINIKNLSFSYNQNEIFTNLNLTINKGDIIGIKGKSGSGKTTLIDILIGLLNCYKGEIYVDDELITNNNIRNFQNIITHVPQTTFLADISIIENIAFGIERSLIDTKKVIEICKIVMLDDIINSLNYKYDTIVGERGVFLSGGQRQRLGIARALYKNASIIIFDEATNALDVNTENIILNSIIKYTDITIIIIAHNYTALKYCNKIYDIESNSTKQL